MNQPFYKNLSEYLKTHDVDNANSVIMEELGKILVKDKENFITLLRFADISVDNNASDRDLIDKFINNIETNRKLLIGASFLTSQHNKQMGFDGEEVISDMGTKAVHRVMTNYFDATLDAIPYDVDFSNLGGIGAVAGAIGGAANLGSTALQGRQKKKYGTQEMVARKEQARQDIINSALEQRKIQHAAMQKTANDEQKRKKIIIITGVSLLGIAVLIGAIYFINKQIKK